jgi:hypothetical protein
MGDYPYHDLYMLDSARQFVPIMRKTKLVLLGGITNRDHVETGMREGFDFVAVGRALLREPDLVNKMIADPAVRSRCTHNNKCMVTVFGRTHCLLDPNQRTARPSRCSRQPGPPYRCNRSASAAQASLRARCARSSIGIVMKP